MEATGREWRSTIVPRYQRRVREVNEAVIATYLAGGNQRRIRGALHPLLKAAQLSKSAVSRIVATLKDGLTAWTARPLTEVDLVEKETLARSGNSRHRERRHRAMTLLDDLNAFYLEHRRCGDLESEVTEGETSCALLARRVSRLTGLGRRSAARHSLVHSERSWPVCPFHS